MLKLVSAVVLIVMTAVACGVNERNASTETLPEVEIQSGFADVPAGQLYYETAGRGEPVVLIHGNIGDRRHWDPQFHVLATHYRAIRYDVRGFGKSSVPLEGTPYFDYQDLVALLDHLGVRSAHVAGWSMGSGIAIDFVLTHPKRARSLISVGPWVSGYSSPAAKQLFGVFTDVRAAIGKGGPPAAVEAFMTAPLFSATIVDPAAGAEFRRIAGDYSFWPFVHESPQQSLQPAAASRTSQIETPTLILTAERDLPACLEVADLLQRSIANSRKVVMKGTGHLLHLEKPDEFNQQLLEFLKKVATGA